MFLSWKIIISLIHFIKERQIYCYPRKERKKLCKINHIHDLVNVQIREMYGVMT